jgi:hypothetical protein
VTRASCCGSNTFVFRAGSPDVLRLCSRNDIKIGRQLPSSFFSQPPLVIISTDNPKLLGLVASRQSPVASRPPSISQPSSHLYSHEPTLSLSHIPFFSPYTVYLLLHIVSCFPTITPTLSARFVSARRSAFGVFLPSSPWSSKWFFSLGFQTTFSHLFTPRNTVMSVGSGARRPLDLMFKAREAKFYRSQYEPDSKHLFPSALHIHEWSDSRSGRMYPYAITCAVAVLQGGLSPAVAGMACSYTGRNGEKYCTDANICVAKAVAKFPCCLVSRTVWGCLIARGNPVLSTPTRVHPIATANNLSFP